MCIISSFSILFSCFLVPYSRQELNARKAELRSLDTEGFNPLTALGGYMPGLVQMIRQNVDKVKTRVCVSVQHVGYRIWESIPIPYR